MAPIRERAFVIDECVMIFVCEVANCLITQVLTNATIIQSVQTLTKTSTQFIAGNMTTMGAAAKLKSLGDRVSTPHFLGYLRCFAVAVLMNAVLNKIDDSTAPLTTAIVRTFTQHLTTVIAVMWIIVYILLMKFILAHKTGCLRDWVKELTNQADSCLTRVSSSETVGRLRKTGSSCVQLLSSAIRQNDRSMVISASEPFLPLHQIARLTLSDIKDIFYYAAHHNHPEFDRTQFAAKLQPSARRAMDALDLVTATSRGGVPLSKREIDALSYAAAVRVFAEWRSVRLVPESSSQRYALGMAMARRDLLQNVTKMELSVHKWLQYQEFMTKQTGCSMPKESPTLRQMLSFELHEGMQTQLPRLAENSFASGLLWSKRQLEYQTRVFENTTQVNGAFPDTKSAVTDAYKATYDKYHGFFVRQLFQSSFEAAPSAKEIFQFMNLARVEDDDHDTATTDSDDDSCWIQLPVESEPFEDLPVNEQCLSKQKQLQQQQQHPLGQVLSEVHRILLQCTGKQVTNDERSGRNLLHCANHIMDPVKWIETTARQDDYDVPSYRAVLRPLIQTLDDLIVDFNMNDPTRV
jgi:hypothetical protein